ncbi:MAG: hypothetical protein Q8L64_05145 [bacterium]|nr:hypothetical protein [bacterium]
MKKMIRKIVAFFERRRMAINILALRKQARIQERLVDKFEDDINILRSRIAQRPDYAPSKQQLQKELDAREADARVTRETADALRNQASKEWNDLFA